MLHFISAVSGMHTSAITNGTQGRFLNIVCPIVPDSVATLCVITQDVRRVAGLSVARDTKNKEDTIRSHQKQRLELQTGSTGFGRQQVVEAAGGEGRAARLVSDEECLEGKIAEKQLSLSQLAQAFLNLVGIHPSGLCTTVLLQRYLVEI